MTTPLINIDKLYFKREDQNTTGSVKDRSIPTQLQNLQQQGIKKAVISSTGNAAISASYYAPRFDIQLTIFVSPKINPRKKNLLKNYSAVISSHTPISDAFKYSKETNSFYLRQSTDPVAQDAYSILGSEIISQLPQCTSIYFPVGSGTTLVGVAKTINPDIKIFAVQPASHPSIAKKFDKSFLPEDYTSTDALSVKFLPLKNQIIDTINLHHGSALAIQDQDTQDAFQWLKDHQINSSPEGALALAGYYKAKRQKLDTGDFPIIIITGANRE